uniref:Uncharacterized protein n=1 Tax=Eutreptiella gymnastica TaxID=73025 RepID=A0A7S4D4A4_9EUGL
MPTAITWQTERSVDTTGATRNTAQLDGPPSPLPHPPLLTITHLRRCLHPNEGKPNAKVQALLERRIVGVWGLQILRHPGMSKATVYVLEKKLTVETAIDHQSLLQPKPLTTSVLQSL